MVVTDEVVVDDDGKKFYVARTEVSVVIIDEGYDYDIYTMKY